MSAFFPVTTADDLPTPRKGWRWSLLRQIARLESGHTPSRREPSYWDGGSVPWLSLKDIRGLAGRYVTETEDKPTPHGIENSSARILPQGTVAFCRTASVGKVAILGRDMATSQDFATWTCGEDLLPEFLLQSLRVMRPFLLGYLSMGSTHKTIYFPDLMDIRIPVPSLGRQADAVASVAEAARDRSQWSEALSNQMSLLSEYKQSLITAAVTGELDVTTAGNRIPG